MLFQLTHQLPQKCIVAVSGGVDSMAALHWLMRGRKVSGVAHVNHNTGTFADRAEKFVENQALKAGLPFYNWRIPSDLRPPNRYSPEQFWREQRYGWLQNVAYEQNTFVVLAHNLDDCIEEYLICTMKRGYSGTIGYWNGRCIRPFRLWSRESILMYAEKWEIPFREDPSNSNTRYLRNYIRKEMMHHVLQVNPGIAKIVERVMREQDRKA